MTREEYQKCQSIVNMYRDKIRECEVLKRRLAQKERENRMLKERLGYKSACDVQQSKDDAEVFLIVKMNRGM
jgi:hypothetical protein